MFERFTESARRALFFARYEASHLPTMSIGTEHVLLGLARQPTGIVGHLFEQANVSLEDVRKEVEARITPGDPLSTSVEIPFNEETTRALLYAGEEADRLNHSYIGTEHLLLGLLRDENSVAGAILHARGLRVDQARNDILSVLDERPDGWQQPLERNAQLNLIYVIRQLVDQLAPLSADRVKGEALAAHIREKLDELSELLRH
jgi:ATP-dependent Clp protease ATP-binding subunit ClpC